MVPPSIGTAPSVELGKERVPSPRLLVFDATIRQYHNTTQDELHRDPDRLGNYR